MIPEIRRLTDAELAKYRAGVNQPVTREMIELLLSHNSSILRSINDSLPGAARGFHSNPNLHTHLITQRAIAAFNVGELTAILGGANHGQSQ